MTRSRRLYFAQFRDELPTEPAPPAAGGISEAELFAGYRGLLAPGPTAETIRARYAAAVESGALGRPGNHEPVVAPEDPAAHELQR